MPKLHGQNVSLCGWIETRCGMSTYYADLTSHSSKTNMQENQHVTAPKNLIVQPKCSSFWLSYAKGKLGRKSRLCGFDFLACLWGGG